MNLPTEEELREAARCPWERKCQCTHTAPCEAGQVAGKPLLPGYDLSWRICEQCDKARRLIAAERGWPVTTRLDYEPRPEPEPRVRERFR